MHAPVSILVLFVLDKPRTSKRRVPTTKPDLDNLLKTVLDALNNTAFDDDGQVLSISAVKRYALANERPYTEIELNFLSDNPTPTVRTA